MSSETILLVDDEPHLLESFVRQLSRDFRIETSLSANVALERIQKENIAVVISDFKLPRMDGVEFLSKVKDISPNTVRVILTGNADQSLAVKAINQGEIFRFLNKPCSTHELVETINSSLNQHRLLVSEKVLLEQTLSGIVHLLTELLAFLSPKQFSASLKVREMIRTMGGSLSEEQRWELELSALLSPIGYLTLPSHVLSKLNKQEILNVEESKLVSKVNEVGANLISSIPRLKKVAEIIRHQDCKFKDIKDSNNNVAKGSGVLKFCKDVVQFSSSEMDERDVFNYLKSRDGWYDPEIIENAEEYFSSPEYTEEQSSIEITPKKIAELIPGDIVVEDLKTVQDLVLLASGRVITDAIMERLNNYQTTVGIIEPVYVVQK